MTIDQKDSLKIAVSNSNRQPTAAAVQELKAALRGQLIRPGDAGYDNARRLWNGAVDKRPAFIVRCRTAQDVVEAVNFARSYDLPLSVRAGSHNTAGLALAEDGLVVDLSQMKGIVVNSTGRIARAQAGLTIGEFVRALQPYGLLTTTGTCSGTGIAGSTLGGGIGWLAGKYGLAIDNVLSFEMVTADGRLLKVSEQENADLFWGLRGGGGNFGIVTSFEYRLHPVGKLLGGMVVHPRSQAGEVLRFYRDFSSVAPDEVVTHAAMMTMPHTGPAIALIVAYAGDDLAEGERILAPLRKFGSPLADYIHPLDYAELIAMLDPTAPDGRNYYDTAYALKQPGDDALEAIVAAGEAISSPFSAIIIHQVSGAATRIAPEATSFALREPHYVIVNSAAWEAGPAEPHIAWAQASLARMQPFINIGLYVNFMSVGNEVQIRDSYQANYERLVALKNKYDPTNFFRFNQNIKPAANRRLVG